MSATARADVRDYDIIGRCLSQVPGTRPTLSSGSELHRVETIDGDLAWQWFDAETKAPEEYVDDSIAMALIELSVMLAVEGGHFNVISYPSGLGRGFTRSLGNYKCGPFAEHADRTTALCALALLAHAEENRQ